MNFPIALFLLACVVASVGCGLSFDPYPVGDGVPSKAPEWLVTYQIQNPRDERSFIRERKTVRAKDAAAAVAEVLALDTRVTDPSWVLTVQLKK